MTTSVHPGLTAGTWNIDPVHSEVSFVVRHMMVSKVRGSFSRFTGAITIGEDQLASSVEADIDVASITTNEEARDNHLRSADFFDLENHQHITYQSTSVEQDGDDFVVHGNLTIKGITREVPLKVEFNGVGPDSWGGTRAGFSATTEISRKDFGIEFNMPLDGGGVVIGDRIQINLEIEAVLAK